jgi:hypothetical protein
LYNKFQAIIKMLFDGETVREHGERTSRKRKHGKISVPFTISLPIHNQATRTRGIMLIRQTNDHMSQWSAENLARRWKVKS